MRRITAIPDMYYLTEATLDNGVKRLRLVPGKVFKKASGAITQIAYFKYIGTDKHAKEFYFEPLDATGWMHPAWDGWRIPYADVFCWLESIPELLQFKLGGVIE